ncbi:E3 SUMO-protein ligase nse2 [Colletotrichum chlorophyti]|uniref:E3 SUMO-protein ligase nse2 n=1 Tax=Colletotrichum chlorophyti TaxID=708187 RepID=A0A1Q8RLK3_9PEZI|nr:E3 SUMO-protein ligase nse2 [Colletotrichum chlorophyti]
MPVLERRRLTQRRPDRRIVVDDDDAGASQSQLPPYQPLECPLTEEAKRAIAELSNSRDVHRYQNHIKASRNHLGSSVALINDNLRDRRAGLQRLVQKRAASEDMESQEKSQREREIEAHVEYLDSQVPTLTANAEAAIRDLIDRQAALEDEKAALADTVSHFQALPDQQPGFRRRSRRGDEEGGENPGRADADEPPPPEQSVVDVLLQNKTQKAREWERLNAYQRYALNNDYAAFKKLWHDAAHGDSEVPLPNANRWFDSNGNPVMPTGRTGHAEEEAGVAAADDDDDLVIAGEVRDYKCPLSMQEFEEPYSSKVCTHTYEKRWIIDMVRKAANQRAECPVAGCSKVLGVDDLFYDPVILRKMKRARELQRLAEEEGNSSTEEEGGNDAPRAVKRERSKSHKRKVEEIDDE